ncbi:hypothetical protein Pelo_17104 [Pelomyxa schiedti]|nr:hypothetical protein Pelo_17104 [Pelomyxa schiedti]
MATIASCPPISSFPRVTTVVFGNQQVGKTTLMYLMSARPRRRPEPLLDGYDPNYQTEFTDRDNLLYVEIRQHFEAVEGALSREGALRVVFIVTVLSGRVSEDGQDLLSFVHQAAPMIGPNYCIVINKVSPGVVNATQEQKSRIETELQNDFPSTSNVYYFPYVKEWTSPNCDPCTFAGVPEFRSFIQQAPTIWIQPGSLNSRFLASIRGARRPLEIRIWHLERHQSATEQLYEESQVREGEHLKIIYESLLDHFRTTGQTCDREKADKAKKELDDFVNSRDRDCLRCVGTYTSNR